LKPGKYKYIHNDGKLTVQTDIDPHVFGSDKGYAYGKNTAAGAAIEYKKFDVFFDDIPPQGYIRGMDSQDGWSTVIEFSSYIMSADQRIVITPENVQADSNSLIQFLKKVEWVKVIDEDRKSFKQVWNLENINERKRILETCHKRYSRNNEIMKCWGTELQASTSQPKENKQGDKNQQANDGQKTDKELQHLTSQTKEKEQEGEKIQQANNGQQNDEKKIDKVNNDEQKADDGEEKTIFANTCFTVSLTLTLGILWFFVLLYIRNTYCLTSTESQEEYEYEESTYDFV
jgi:hypothetical protein